jgi:hypothetical protein
MHLGCALALACAWAPMTVSAQTSFAAGTEIILPLAANVGIYHSQVFLRNPNPLPITVNVRYYQSNNGTAPSGLRTCSQIVLQGDQSSSFDLGSQCGLTGTNDDFGMIILEDVAGANPFFAYSRTQTPDGIGFSVEGFPTSNFSGSPSSVLGLRSIAAPPTYRSNCFVAALDQPVNWHLDLVQSGTETVLASTSGSLQAFETTRILDVFASAGVVGDHTNVSAQFSTTDNPAPHFVGFCTLETSSNGSADFRIAKNTDSPNSGGSGSGDILNATFNGTIQSLSPLTLDYQFIGSSNVTLASATQVSVSGGGWFGKTGVGVSYVNLAVCYQDQDAAGPILLMGLPANFIVTGTTAFHYVTASAMLTASTYKIGLCALNVGINSVNANGTSSGFIFTVP